MPSVTLHLRLAEQVLETWRTHPRGAPFAPDDPGPVNAFRLGAMGPDLGYIPGGYRPISDLAHAFRTGDLARSLTALAQTPVERAFAWGWVTHHLADSLIHPLVGCAVGELVHGTPARFVDGDEDQVSHIRVEVGLDALYAERHPELRAHPLRPCLDGRTARFVSRAFRRTYGATPGVRRILESQLRAPRRLNQALGLAAMSALAMPSHADQTGNPPGAVTRLRSFVSRQSLSLSFLLPAPPRLWLINAVRDVEETFAEMFMEEFALEGGGLANVNLDTGRPDLEEIHYSGLHRALAFIAGRGGQPPRLDERPALGAA